MSDEPHVCWGKLPLAPVQHLHDSALFACREEQGRLWVWNYTGTSQVNYCPYCGYKARIQLHRERVPDEVLPYDGDHDWQWLEDTQPPASGGAS